MEMFIASGTLGIGYLLVFAAFYKQGKYAARPWQSLAERSGPDKTAPLANPSSPAPPAAATSRAQTRGSHGAAP